MTRFVLTLTVALALAVGHDSIVPCGSAVAAPIPKAKAKLPPPTEKEYAASANNLKQILLAMHNFESTNLVFPSEMVDGDGNPTLSWRVHLLPYLEETPLYKQFKLDEPWDSANNKKLISKMPKAYAPVRVTADDGMTFYRGFNGEHAFFETGKPQRIVGLLDGLSNTVAVVEAGEACIWTKPDDLPYDAKKELPKLGGLFDGDFHVAMCDGSVRLVCGSKVIDTAFRAAITRDGGEVIAEDAAFPKVEKKDK